MVNSVQYNKAVQTFGKEYVDQALSDYSSKDMDKDGIFSGQDMQTFYSTVYKNVFADNSKLAERAEEIAQKQGELFIEYAGEDGALDIYEFLTALNSDENRELLDEYWSMRDTNDILNKLDKLNNPSASKETSKTENVNNSQENSFVSGNSEQDRLDLIEASNKAGNATRTSVLNLLKLLSLGLGEDLSEKHTKIAAKIHNDNNKYLSFKERTQIIESGIKDFERLIKEEAELLKEIKNGESEDQKTEFVA